VHYADDQDRRSYAEVTRPTQDVQIRPNESGAQALASL
jgi:hypothetical protein